MMRWLERKRPGKIAEDTKGWPGGVRRVAPARLEAKRGYCTVPDGDRTRLREWTVSYGGVKGTNI
jgi:hypothetical protein